MVLRSHRPCDRPPGPSVVPTRRGPRMSGASCARSSVRRMGADRAEAREAALPRGLL